MVGHAAERQAARFRVLDTIRVNSPSEAVKAAIAAEQTAQK